MVSEFNPNGETHYRAATERHAKNAGIVLHRRWCHACDIPKESADGKIIRGTSRWNPEKFYCAEC